MKEYIEPPAPDLNLLSILDEIKSELYEALGIPKELMTENEKSVFLLDNQKVIRLRNL